MDGMTDGILFRTSCINAIQFRDKSVLCKKSPGIFVYRFFIASIKNSLSVCNSSAISAVKLVQIKLFKDFIVIANIIVSAGAANHITERAKGYFIKTGFF